MALSKNISKTVPGFNGEVLAEDVYFKVAAISGDKESMSATVLGFSDDVQVYAQNHYFSPDLNGDNFIRQAYLHLKTLPEFADAIDC